MILDHKAYDGLVFNEAPAFKFCGTTRKSQNNMKTSNFALLVERADGRFHHSGGYHLDILVWCKIEKLVEPEDVVVTAYDNSR